MKDFVENREWIRGKLLSAISEEFTDFIIENIKPPNEAEGGDRASHPKSY